MKAAKNSVKLPGRFNDLVAIMVPRAIIDDVQLDNTTDMIDQLMASGSLTKGQESYMETLVQLVEAYEREHHEIDVSGVSGIDSLKELMKQNDMRAIDLSRLLGVSATLGSKILTGTRSLTVGHLKILAKRFRVRMELFA
jgi:HTH-type transcriptional regulator/antitoxin HigA